MTLYEYLRAAAVCGFDAKTALMFPPGTVFDTLDQMSENNKKEEADD